MNVEDTEIDVGDISIMSEDIPLNQLQKGKVDEDMTLDQLQKHKLNTSLQQPKVKDQL